MFWWIRLEKPFAHAIAFLLRDQYRGIFIARDLSADMNAAEAQAAIAA